MLNRTPTDLKPACALKVTTVLNLAHSPDQRRYQTIKQTKLNITATECDTNSCHMPKCLHA